MQSPKTTSAITAATPSPRQVMRLASGEVVPIATHTPQSTVSSPGPASQQHKVSNSKDKSQAKRYTLCSCTGCIVCWKYSFQFPIF